MVRWVCYGKSNHARISQFCSLSESNGKQRGQENAGAEKKTLGRRKIEIKKIEKKTSLQVTFAKRRAGLFRKASELALLCGAEVAIIVQSPADKIYSFSHPSVEALINRLTLSPAEAEASSSLSQWQNARRCDEERRKCEEAVKMLEMEKMRAADSEKNNGGFWWEEAYEGLELHQLEEFASALENLGERVEERLKEFENFSNSLSAQQGFCASSSNSIQYGDLDITDYDDCLISDLDIIAFSS